MQSNSFLGADRKQEKQKIYDRHQKPGTLQFYGMHIWLLVYSILDENELEDRYNTQFVQRKQHPSRLA